MPLGRCDVDWHVDRGIVAVACVGRDMIKLWPLPVEQPWFEEAIEMPDSWLAVLKTIRAGTRKPVRWKWRCRLYNDRSWIAGGAMRMRLRS